MDEELKLFSEPFPSSGNLKEDFYSSYRWFKFYVSLISENDAKLKRIIKSDIYLMIDILNTGFPTNYHLDIIKNLNKFLISNFNHEISRFEIL